MTYRPDQPSRDVLLCSGTTMDKHSLEDPESDDAFAFETDHLALRGNNDYCKLIKYIVGLEAQKVQAIKDLDVVAEELNKALDEPVAFIQNLKSGRMPNLPCRQVFADLPDIEWEKYGIDPNLETNIDIRKFKMDDSLKVLDDSLKVRGRKFTDNKPETFNQLWSVEEQKRLEELLEIYPEEPVEARRYKKIADALGTRTPIQVMSRIQKYFTKLAKAGLPIPGRFPKKVKKDQRYLFYKKSTFFPQLHVPIKMEDPNDLNDIPEASISFDGKGGQQHALELLKTAKEQRALDEVSPVYQTRTMCVGCQKTGFLGARWTDNAGTDYCTDCVVKLLPLEKLIPVRHII